MPGGSVCPLVWHQGGACRIESRGDSQATLSEMPDLSMSRAGCRDRGECRQSAAPDLGLAKEHVVSNAAALLLPFGLKPTGTETHKSVSTRLSIHFLRRERSSRKDHKCLLQGCCPTVDDTLDIAPGFGFELLAKSPCLEPELELLLSRNSQTNVSTSEQLTSEPATYVTSKPSSSSSALSSLSSLSSSRYIVRISVFQDCQSPS